ncbi:MAG TPA: efflux RND transporter periplasmic adaptor subunit, partial [Aquella sp.]|nr:efflux RND transporter periplasmic adaptor subunit [Aquella sp.]
MMKNFFLIFLCIVSASCSKKPAPTDEAKHVDVQEVYAYDVPYILNYPAMVQGVVDYQVIPRISGAIYKKFYKEGAYVKKEQPLYEIDPRPYELQLKNFEGQLIKDKAAEVNLKSIYDRYVDLYTYNAVAKQDVETARINYKAAVGNVETDIANIDQAKLNLLYCLVRSPADGYIAQRMVTEGTMVTAFQTVLNNINSVNDMYLLFSMPENQRVDIEDGVLDKTVLVPKNYTFRIDLQLANGKMIKDSGYVEFTDTRISLTNGVWNMRAYVDNKYIKNKLLSGQYVTVYIHGIKYLNTYSLPQQSVLHDDAGAFVYVVKNNHAIKRHIKTGKMYDSSWMITSGLKDGDIVITNGNIRIHENSLITIDKRTNSKTGNTVDNMVESNNIIVQETNKVSKLNGSSPAIAKSIEKLN